VAKPVIGLSDFGVNKKAGKFQKGVILAVFSNGLAGF
jgi:hypothetical protein